MPPKPIHVVGAAIINNARCLATQRGPDQSLPGKWEFPGGKIEDNESPRDALAREIEEELNLRVQVSEFIATGTAQVGDRQIILDVYAAALNSGEIVLREHSAFCWLHAEKLHSLDWAEADIPVLASVRRWMTSLRRP